MVEGLAVWALLVYFLRLLGMPWNKFSKSFSLFGGGAWLLVVWIGMLNFAPMDMTGNSLVQAPHIELRTDAIDIDGAITKIHISPNQRVKKGQTIYEIDAERYQIDVKKALSEFENAQLALDLAEKDINVYEARLAAANSDLISTQHQLRSAKQDLDYKQRTYQRFIDQNQALPNTVSSGELDKQKTLVDRANSFHAELVSRQAQKQSQVVEAQLSVERAKLTMKQQETKVAEARQKMERAQWNLEHTRVEAPADGYVTNFVVREGQYVGLTPRIHMYTNEKYVLMRVNHQAIRNIKLGSRAEFATAVYPAKIFSAQVEGIIEATAESQGRLFSADPRVNFDNDGDALSKYHFVRLRLLEPEGYDIPVGSTGMAWISGDKPYDFWNFLDIIRGVLIRIRAQIFYFYAL